MNLYGQALRDAIDEAIAEIDRVEEDMLELFAELLGPDTAVQVARYAKAQEADSPLRKLMRDEPNPQTPRADPSSDYEGPPNTPR